MQQSKISAFFMPLPPAPRCSSPSRSDGGGGKKTDLGESETKESTASSSSKFLNKKRSYAQYHLELGQSDFLLHSCSVCGMMYCCGDEGDEKMHKAFHKNYYEGIQFKGWRDERVVLTLDGDRVLLVADGDPPAHKRKVKEVLNIIEKELGFSEGRLLNKLCKVYLFISGHRIVGCLVAEPIRAALRVIANSDKNSDLSYVKSHKLAQNSERQCPNLQFGGVSFKRDFVRRNDSMNRSFDQCQSGAILCDEESVPAICGFRAIWVVPSQRRKGIASKLLDAARKSFCPGEILEHSQCAFSSPTSSGRALASKYCNNDAFLIYRENDVGVITKTL
ncbi:protein CHROMOSOME TRANSMISSION FIDELITY 7 [Canna indica]|uniref:Protein CHROMOSOME TRANSMISSION FIDELITY 7 n=1 Tax=Canna indica TaxID=4628 RepID=A0AAQ3KIN2_9LILI|nr:protein CHROMOSOME TRANSMISSION FIDELITY 7 [Canna indica]